MSIMIRKSFIILVLTAFTLVAGCDTEETETFTTFRSFSLFGEGVAIDVDAEYETLIADGVPHLDYNGTSFFIGYRQVSSNNQDPVMMRFDNGELTWVRTDLETSADDSKGYGVFWDGAETMYAVFSSTGTQGEPSSDFRRFATNSWIPSYGHGGGSKIAIIARINIQTGQPEVATFVKAKLSNGNANSVVVKSLQLSSGNNLLVTANAWYSPLDIHAERMECEGNSPFSWTLQLSHDLSQALSSEATGCCCGS